MDVNHLVRTRICWLRPWRKKFWQFLWGISSLIIKRSHTSIRFFSSWQFRPIKFPLQRTKCIAQQSSNVLRVYKISIDTLMEKMELVVLETKRYYTQEKSKTVAPSGCFGPKTFRCVKRYPQKQNHWMLLYTYKTFDQNLVGRTLAVCFGKNCFSKPRQIEQTCSFYKFPPINYWQEPNTTTKSSVGFKNFYRIGWFSDEWKAAIVFWERQVCFRGIKVAGKCR